MVKMSGDSLLSVINDILDFSKIEAEKLDIEPINFKLRDCLGETTDTLALLAKQKNLELTCHILPDVPGNLIGDPGRLRQIIVNIIGNAIKFTDKGEVALRVEKKSQTEDEVELHFSIIDTGIGISAEKKDMIFEAFSQADGSTTREYGGTGLGLAISSELVELMNGQIGVESEVGQGSKFHFTVRMGLQKILVAEQVPVELKSLQDFSVLVVESNATNRFILNEMLTHWRMNPTTVDNAKTALVAMEQTHNTGKPFALVLLDARMPEMNGFDLAKRIRDNPKFVETKMVMLSSIGQRGEVAHCEELNINGYLSKPVKQSELLDIIATIFGKSLGNNQPSLVTRHSIRENRQRLHILLAEDNLVNQKLATRVLRKRGHTVVVANNGKEALKTLKKESFDLFMTDVQMPEMDGLEATMAIRKQEKGTEKHIPIIAMTANAMKSDQERCFEVGMDGYVSKPIKAEELFEAIEGSLANSTGIKTKEDPNTIPLKCSV